MKTALKPSPTACNVAASTCTTTPDTGLRGASDERQTAHALAEGRVIFTQDQDFLRINAEGIPHAGLAYCHQGKRGIGDIIQSLTEIWERMAPEEMRNWLVYL